MQIAFAKYEGLGNDFIIVDGVDIAPAQAIALCDRHLGIGADGVLIVDLSAGEPSMRVINADGSVPEMCGNGIRCVAWHLVRTGRRQAREMRIETDAGPHRCELLDDGRVAVEMAVPSLDPASVPVRSDGEVIDRPFDVGGDTVRLTAVSMGNPHAVTFDDVGERRRTLGPAIQNDPRFPKQANVGFARLAADGSIDLDVYERGAGWTRACGTGACAAGVAAVETGRAERGAKIAVRLPGGRLDIVVGPLGRPVTMTGPARHVYDGTIELG